MTLFQRRILFATFIIIFLLLTPAISFYAAGYDFNFQSGRVRATGILIIKTQPEEAVINLGDKKKYNWLYNLFYGDSTLTTPRKIRNLLPDEYEMKLIKQGYFDYERKIDLKSRQTLVLGDIILFKKSTPFLEVKGNILAEKLSPDKTKLAVLTDEDLTVINLANNQRTEIPLESVQPSKLVDVLWAPSNKKVLLTINNYPVINIENSNLDINLKKLVGASIKDVQWDLFSDNIIYVNSGNDIKQIDIVQKDAHSIFTQRIASDFLIKDGNVYTVNEISSVLNIYSLNNQELIASIPILSGRDYEFINHNHNLVNLFNSKNNMLYLVGPWSLLPIQDSIANFKDGIWLDGKRILYWNDFEIWLKDGTNKKLLTRVSTKINKVLKHPKANYIIYSTSNDLNVIEFSENYNKTFKILEFTDIESLQITTDGSHIYFQGKIGEQEGLYRLKIR